ncbi:MAG: hypothetical protein ACK53K_03635 [Burkholderiales bacterium]
MSAISRFPGRLTQCIRVSTRLQRWLPLDCFLEQSPFDVGGARVLALNQGYSPWRDVQRRAVPQ